MASLIKIKRSTGTAAPSALEAGELAYSFGTGSQSNGGDRLYFGNGSTIDVIGGKYFTGMLDHVPGTLTASSALLVDANSKLDNLKVDNLDLNGNTISSTDTNGNVTLDPNGNGKVEFALANNAAAYVTVTGPTATQYKDNLITADDDNAIPNKKYVDDAILETGAGALTITSPDGTPTTAELNFATEDLEFDGVGGIEFSITQGTGKVSVTATLTQSLDPSAAVKFTSVTIDDTLVLDNNTVSTTDGDLTLTAGGSGNVVANRLEVTDLTETRVVFVGAGDQLVDDANFTFNSSTDTLSVTGAVQVDNLNLNGNTLSSTDTAGDINITPIVDGDVNVTTTGTADINLTVPSGREVITSTLAVSDLTANRLVATSTNGALITDDDLTFDGTNLNLTGVFNADNIRIDGNTISSTNTNGNIVLDPNGTGTVEVSGAKITGVATPTASTDAANKQYVDDTAQGLRTLPAADAFSASNLSATYDNGTSGVGATLTATSNGAITIDGVSLSLNDNVIVNGQTDKTENGSYFVSQVGDGSNPWILTRCTFCDEPDEVKGSFEFVTGGTTYANTGWVLTANTDPVVFGTTEFTWVQFSGAGTYIAGDGLALNGTTFSVNVDDSTIEINADTLRVKDAGITNAKLANDHFTIATDGTGADFDIQLGDTWNFNEGEGIDITIGSDTITIAAEDATSSNKGIASFNATDFTVTNGAVTIANVNLGTQTTGDYVATVSVTAGTGLSVTGTGEGAAVTLAGVDATTTTKGVASFNTNNFTVTSGAVSTKDITLGSSTLTNGSTTTAIAGLTQLTVDNVDINGNTISTTDTNGNLVLSPNGTGSIDADTSKIINVVDPTNAQDAATKNYVDTTVSTAASNATLTVDADTGTDVSVNLSADDLQFVANANGLSTSVAKVGNDVTVTFALAQDIQTSASPTFQDMALNGGDLTTTATTFNLVNTGATTVNFAGAANTIAVGSASSTVTFGNDVTITGDLIVNGDTVTVNVATLQVEDPLIALATGNTANSLSIGFYGAYNDGTSKLTGLYRDHTTGVYKLFADGTIANNVVTTTTLADLTVGTLEGTIDGGTY